MIKIVMTLDVCAFLYSMLLLIVYFSKKRIKSFETSIFSNLIFVAIASIVLEFFQLLFSFLNFEKYYNLIYIIAFLYVLSYFIMILFTSSYIILKLYMGKERDSTKIQKLKNKLIISSLIISIIFYIIAMVFSTSKNIVFDGDSYYGTGLSVVFMVICYIILASVVDYAIIFNRKKNTYKDKIFYFSIVGLLFTNMGFRLVNPGLMVNNLTNVFMIAVMFFSIENPDAKLIEDLENANNEKDSFLSSMSHEMKTPLNAILGLSSVGEGDNWKGVNNQANILLDIVNNVIDSNGFDENKIRTFKDNFNIKNSLSSVIDETKNNIVGKPIIFNSNIPDVNIVANSEAIISICDRLISNAYKFTERGFITLNIEVSNNKLNINIKDSGKGITADILDNILKQFNNIENNEIIMSDIGLGLSLVKFTVDALYGSIDIKSVVDEGTEVSVTLPIERG